MITIKQLNAFIYEVNAKEINTMQSGWGRELTAAEYKALNNYRKGIDNHNVIRFLIGAQVPFKIGANYVKMRGTEMPEQMEHFCLVPDTEKQAVTRFNFKKSEFEGYLLKDLNTDEADYFRSIKSRKFEIAFENESGKIYTLKS